MKNKRGFTLIELLITVVIMVSILVIAIVSVSNLSKKQKENSYERVKEQILTAATDYFGSNEYLFEKEELDTDGTTIITGYITLKSLVENGYLNVLTNPMDGTKLNECNYVKVTKDNGITQLDYVEDDGCGMDNQITYNHIVKNCPAVNLSFVLNGTTGNDDWYKSNVIEEVVSTTENGKNISLERTEGGSTLIINSSTYDHMVSTEFSVRKVKYKAISECGSFAATEKSYGIDKTPPTIIPLKIREGSKVKNTIVQTEYVDSTWTNKDIYNKFNISDNLKLASAKRILSGAVSSSASINVSSNSIDTASWINSGNGEIKLKITAIDEAGNDEDVEYIIKRDTIAPAITYKDVSGKYSTSETPTTWNKDGVTFSVSAKDSLSGINPTSSKINNALFYVEWDSGDGSLNHYINSNGTKQAGGSSTEVVADITESNGTYTRTNGGLGGEGKRWEIYKACDNAGNCGEKKIYVNIDKTPPTIKYIDTHEDKDKSGYVQIFSVDSGSALSWRKGEAKFNVEMTDGLSGINIDKYGIRKFARIWWNDSGLKTYGNLTQTKDLIAPYDEFAPDNVIGITNGYKRVDGGLVADGARHETYTVCDNADNCTTRDIYAKIDNTPPYTPSPKTDIIDSNWSAYQNNGYKFYQGLWCTLTDIDIWDFNRFKTAGDSWIPKLTTKNSSTSCGNGGDCFPAAGAFTLSNYESYMNSYRNVYCTVKKKGNADAKPQPFSAYFNDNLSTVRTKIKWIHNATGSSAPATYYDWSDNPGNLSYNVSVAKNRATYVIYMIKLIDEAGNESKTFRLDISPCYGNGNNKCADGGSNTNTWTEWNATTAKIN